jgi:hypothetical protein
VQLNCNRQQVSAMSDNIKNFSLKDVSRYSKINLEFIHSLTSEIILLLKRVPSTYEVFLSSHMFKIQKRVRELCHCWAGLKNHFRCYTGVFIGENYCPNVMLQIDQISFLVKFVEENAFRFCCISRSIDVCFETTYELKACFELLKNLLEIIFSGNGFVKK